MKLGWPRCIALPIALRVVFVIAVLVPGQGQPVRAQHADVSARYLYVWAGHVNHMAADFLAVIDFDAASPGYGQVVNTVRLPARGGKLNEPHHMHLSVDRKILGCGGLLSVLSDQPGIFFFDTSDPRKPRFLFSTSDRVSSITDDFFPMPNGGFLITQMGAANGNSPGRVVEFDGKLRRVGSWPPSPPLDGFNPHGISVRPDLNMMMTSDFILPASTLNVVPGPPVLPNTIRVWDFKQRTIVKTIEAPEAVGTMDVKMIPRDIRGRAYTAGMFNGLIYLVDSRRAQRHQRSIPTRRGECHRSFSSPAAVRVAAFPGEGFAATSSRLLPALDPATQALAVRIGLDNPKDRLRPGMAATVGWRSRRRTAF